MAEKDSPEVIHFKLLHRVVEEVVEECQVGTL